MVKIYSLLEKLKTHTPQDEISLQRGNYLDSPWPDPRFNYWSLGWECLIINCYYYQFTLHANIVEISGAAEEQLLTFSSLVALSNNSLLGDPILQEFKSSVIAMRVIS